jgi:hypothetical protein
MTLRSGAVLACSALALAVAACGGGSTSKSAVDKASGLTVSVAGDHVTLKRSANSTSGTGGTSGQVSCIDDYRKLVGVTTEPAPTLAWYAATLITWPAAGKESTATLSHALSNDPQLCIAQTSNSSVDVVLYFKAKVKTEIAREEQASQASSALRVAAQDAVATVSKGSFPAKTSIITAITAKGLYIKQAAQLSGVSQTGTIYLITSQTTTKKLVLALKSTNGTIQTATQGVTGSAKLATAKA